MCSCDSFDCRVFDGDVMSKVICINGNGYYLTTGKEYERIKVTYKYNFIRVKNDVGIIMDYPSRRFKELQ